MFFVKGICSKARLREDTWCLFEILHFSPPTRWRHGTLDSRVVVSQKNATKWGSFFLFRVWEFFRHQGPNERHQQPRSDSSEMSSKQKTPSIGMVWGHLPFSERSQTTMKQLFFDAQCPRWASTCGASAALGRQGLQWHLVLQDMLLLLVACGKRWQGICQCRSNAGSL